MSVIRSLEICAERKGDIVPEVYERFFARHPGALELMGHSDEYMRGRMFEQVLELLMSDEHFGAGGYLDWELDNHLVAYQVAGDMYDAFFDAVLEVVREGAAELWTEADATAWRERIDMIMAHVRVHPAVVGEPA